MLVLERKNRESISIFVEGQEIKINLVTSLNGSAKIGIDAPKEVLILRGELLDAPPESSQYHSKNISPTRQ